MKASYFHFKILPVLFSFFFINQLCSGQAALVLLIFGNKLATEELHLSIDGALNTSNISGFGSGQAVVGLNFGLGLHVKLNEHWEFNPQFRPLSQKGLHGISPITILPVELSDEKTQLRMNYIELPLMIRYQLSKRVYVGFGPQLSFLVSARQRSLGNYLNGEQAEFKINVMDEFAKLDFSLPAEFGYWLKVRNKKGGSDFNFSLFLRYQHGFNELLNNSGSGTRMSTWQLGISIPTIRY